MRKLDLSYPIRGCCWSLCGRPPRMELDGFHLSLTCDDASSNKQNKLHDKTTKPEQHTRLRPAQIF
jgi:hypothetical protein